MLETQSKGSIKLQCTEQALPEFPNLLFGTQIETGDSYFDATHYLQKQAPDKSIRTFISRYQHQIEALCNAYDTPIENAYKINEQGHYLIDGNLVYLFISFVEPNFLAYMCDRIHEVMTSGITVSDTYLASCVKSRLTKEVINMIFEDENSNQNR